MSPSPELYGRCLNAAPKSLAGHGFWFALRRKSQPRVARWRIRQWQRTRDRLVRFRDHDRARHARTGGKLSKNRGRGFYCSRSDRNFIQTLDIVVFLFFHIQETRPKHLTNPDRICRVLIHHVASHVGPRSRSGRRLVLHPSHPDVDLTSSPKKGFGRTNERA